MQMTTIEVFDAIKAHVEAGGWLNAAWPLFAIPNRPVSDRVLDAAWDLAVTHGLVALAEENYILDTDAMSLDVSTDDIDWSEDV